MSFVKRIFSHLFLCVFACVVFAHNAFGATPVFSVTTTSLSAGDTFQFNISAAGTFYVDCDGGTLSGTGVSGGTIINRQNTTTNDTYTCTYSSDGVKTISFYNSNNHVATDYNTNTNMAAISFSGNTYVRELAGDLSAVFPQVGNLPSFAGAFSGCTNLTTIPSTLFAGITASKNNMFNSTFSNCTSLTSIPGTLFSGITTGANNMFWGTFYGCSGLISLPNGLFSNVVNTANTYYLFDETFAYCTGLTSIPGDLFSGITTGANYMFDATFSNCTHLTSIPSNLFSNITTSAAYMFSYTFRDCIGLQSIPEGLFDGITTGAENMFYNTFLKCSGLKYLPDGLFSKITTPASRMFMETFRECSDLGRNSDPVKNFIPPTFFKGLVDNGSPTASQIMNFMFYETNLRTQCPENYYKYTTGYESDWNNKVSCEQCPNGKVSPEGSTNINQCARRDYVFSLNTTGLNANDEFKFLIAAKGTFFIDCGTDGVLTSSANDLAVLTDGGYRVIRTYANNATTYTCTYSTEGPKTIQFGGEATEYSNFAAIRFNIDSTNYDTNAKKIASISGSLGQIFGTVANISANIGQPKFLQTFHGASNMTGTIPPTLFDGIYGEPAINMFNSTFRDCSGLIGFGNKTYVPGDFLENINTNTSISYQAYDMFSGTQLANSCPAGTYDSTRTQFNDAGKPWCTECPTGTTSLAGATDISQCNQTITPSNPTTYTVTYHSGNCHPEHQTDNTDTTHSVSDSVHPATGDIYTVNMDISGTLSPLFVEFNSMNFPTGNYDKCARFDYWVDDNGNNYSPSTNVSNPVDPIIAPYGSSNTNLYARCSWWQIEAGFYPGTCSGTGSRYDIGTYGASISMPSATSTNISEPANYHFSGWSTDSNATNVNYEVSDSYTIDICVFTNNKNDEPYIKFYAVCSPNTYNINYHNVSNSTWANTYVYGVGASVGVPSRTGYTFLGWCVNNSNCSNYANNVTGYTISTTDTGDVDLYAMWQASQSQQDTVNLVWIDDGTVSQSVGNPSNSCSWGNSVFNLPTAKGKHGHTFIGWLVTNYVDDSCGLKSLPYNNVQVNADWDSDHARWKPIDPTTGLTMAQRFGTENSSDLSAGEWAVTFHYGTVKGMAKCSETNGTYATAGNPSDTPGGYCWCEITEYTPSGGEQCGIRSPFWVFSWDEGSLCESECAYLCAERVDGSPQFRLGVYGQTQSN